MDMEKKKPQMIELPKINPGIIGIWRNGPYERDRYFVVDERPDVGEYYINTYVVENMRTIQKHNTIQQLKNHMKDYRFKYCKKVVASDNPAFRLPSIDEYKINFI